MLRCAHEPTARRGRWTTRLARDGRPDYPAGHRYSAGGRSAATRGGPASWPAAAQLLKSTPCIAALGIAEFSTPPPPDAGARRHRRPAGARAPDAGCENPPRDSRCQPLIAASPGPGHSGEREDDGRLLCLPRGRDARDGACFPGPAGSALFCACLGAATPRLGVLPRASRRGAIRDANAALAERPPRRWRHRGSGQPGRGNRT